MTPLPHPRPSLRLTLSRLRRRAWLFPVFLLVLLLLWWPAVMLGVGAFRTSPPGMPGTWSWIGVVQTFATPKIAIAVGNSLLLALVTTATGLLFAVIFAFLAQRTDAPLRRLITPTMMIVFATPSLFYAMAYSLIANKFTGYANDLLRLFFGPDACVFNIESWGGLLLVTSLRATAFVYLFLAPSFRALDRSHEDASLVSGVGKLGTLFRINLPLLAPALTGAAILGLVAGLHSFDVALVLGEPAGIRVIATEVYDMLVHAYPPAYAQGSFISLLLVILVGVLCVLQARIMGRRNYVTVSGKSTLRAPHALRRGRSAAGILIVLFMLLGVAAPVAALVYGSLQPFPGVYGTLTLLHFERVFSRPGTWAAVRTTIMLAIGVGGLTMLFAVVLAQVSASFDTRVRSFLRFSTLIPYAMPGIVAALAVTWAYVSVPGLRLMYGTVWMLVVALIVVVLPFAMQTAQAAISQISPELAAAARVSGASALGAGIGIVGRLIAPSFFVGWFFVAIIIAGNLDVPLLLGTPTLGTIASQIFILQSQGQMGDATALLVSAMGGALAIAALGALAWNFARRTRRSAAPVATPLPSSLTRPTFQGQHA